MTLRNSSLKSLSIEDLKQNKYFIIIHTIILLLITTLPALVIINNYNHQLEININLLRDIYETLTAGTGFTFIAVCIIGTIIGTISFSYLFSVKSVIFYHSMPHKRETIFVSKLLSGIISIIIPLAIVFVVNMIIYFSTGFFADVNFKYFVSSYLIILLMYIFTFSVSSLAASFASNVFAQYIVLGFMYLVYPITAGVLMGFVEVFTNTFSYMPPLFNKEEYLFPPMQLMTNISFDFGDIFLTRYSIDMPHCIYTLVVSILAMAAAVLFYRKRKTENTNKFICFNFGKTFLKYYITSVAAVGASLIFYEISYQSIIGALVGLALGAFIVFSVLEAIFEKSVKSMFKNVKGYVCVTVVLCIALAVSSKVMSNLDNKFPDSAKMIKFNHMSGGIHEVNNLVLEDEENIKHAINLLQKAADVSAENAAYHDHVNVTTDAYDFWGISRHFNNISGEDMEEFISKTYDSEEYKNNLTDFGEDDVNHINFSYEKVKYTNMLVHYDGWDEKEKGSDERAFKVLDALKNDIKKYSYTETKNSDTEFAMNFGVDGRYRHVTVKECYAETLNALKEYGFILGENESVAKMAFMNYETEGSDFDDNYGVDDETVLKLMLDQPLDTDAWNQKRLSVRFYFADGTLATTSEYVFDNLPDEVKQYIVDNNIPVMEQEKQVDAKTGEPMVKAVEIVE